jgi:UDP-N-acetylglucosamine acyltransferase
MTEPDIHPTAIVSPDAELAEGTVIGPYAVVHAHVEIGANTRIGPHAVINDYVRMGANNTVHAHAMIGDLPQDLAFDPSTVTWVEIGDGNVLREGVTVHRATVPASRTRIGSNCYLMVNAHVAHDCTLGDNVIMTNNAGLAGHVEIDNNAVLGAYAVVHQFCRIGRNAMLAGFIPVRKDVLPYTMVAGNPSKHYRLNTVGLRRAGIKGERYRVLEQAYRAVRSGDKALLKVDSTEEVEHLREWLSRKSKRGLTGFLAE